MLEENFDNKIKSKLESIDVDYSEAAWQKLKRSLPVPWYASFLRDHGGWVYGGLTTAALIGSYFINQNIKKENQILNDKINTIKVENTANTNLKTDTVYIDRKLVDTVYITKYVYRDKGLQALKKNSIDEEVKLLFNKNKKQTEFNSTKKEVALNKVEGNLIENNELVTKVKPSTNTEIEKRIFAGKNDNSKEKVIQNHYGNLEKADKKPDIKTENENTLQTKPTEGNYGNTTTAIPKEAAAVQEERILETAKETESIVKNNDLIIPENVVTKAPDTKKKPRAKSDSKLNLRPNVGILADLRDKEGSTLGPLFELMFKDNWGFNTGLLFSSIISREFHQEDDFLKNTGKSFDDHFKNNAPPQPPGKINEIYVKSRFIKIPLFMNYYLPLKKGFSFVISTGTKLNVGLIEKVSYNTDNNGQNQNHSFENKVKPKVFNNWNYGMGFQYHKGRWMGQIVPFFEFPFQKDPDLVSPQKYGVNAILKFSLKK